MAERHQARLVRYMDDFVILSGKQTWLIHERFLNVG